MSAQEEWEWAPVGATWTYECFTVFEPSYVCSLEVVKDTLIQGLLAKIFSVASSGAEDCNFDDNITIMHYDNGRIYWLLDSFRLLYDFNALSDDTLHREDVSFNCGSEPDTSNFHLVDSIGISTIQDIDYRVLNLLYNPSDPRFGREIGFVHELFISYFLLPYPIFVVDALEVRLMCYSDPNLTLRFTYDNYPEVQIEVVDSCDFQIVGTEDILHADEVAIFPNPVSEVLFIDTEIDVSSIALFDMTGKTLVHKYTDGLTSQNRKINVSNYPAGIYILKIMSERKYRFEKLVISH